MVYLGFIPNSAAVSFNDALHDDFDDEALAQLRFIRAAKNVGFTLNEIKELLELTVLPQDACGDVAALFGRKINGLERQMREIRRMRRTLVSLLDHCRKRRPRSRECLALSAFWPMRPQRGQGRMTRRNRGGVHES